jgi:hypothetical protein
VPYFFALYELVLSFDSLVKVLSRRVLSCLVLSWLVLSCLVLPCLVVLLSCLVLSSLRTAQMYILAFVKHRVHLLNSFAEKRPVLTAAVVTSIKSWLADLMVQKMVERRDTVDKRRSALFFSFGLLYQGCFQYWMYNVLYEKVLFPGCSAKMTLAKIVATNIISDPVFFFPAFYCFQEALSSENLSDLDPTKFVPAALRKYKENYWPDWVNSWMIWVPAHGVTYAVVPPHLRMPWIAGVSFGYVSLLSFTRGGYDK